MKYINFISILSLITALSLYPMQQQPGKVKELDKNEQITIFLGTWTNNTNTELRIETEDYDSNPNATWIQRQTKRIITTLKPGETKKINEPVFLYYDTHMSIYSRSKSLSYDGMINIENTDPLSHYPSWNGIRSLFFQFKYDLKKHTLLMDPSDYTYKLKWKELDLSNFGSDDKIAIYIDGTLNGKDNLKDTTWTARASLQETTSLKKETIRTLVDKVIDKQLTLEQIKTMVPAEVFEEIINHIIERVR